MLHIGLTEEVTDQTPKVLKVDSYGVSQRARREKNSNLTDSVTHDLLPTGV